MKYSKEFMNWVKTINQVRREENFLGWFHLLDDDEYPNYRGFLIADLKTGKVTCSYCHPDDIWNDDIGLAIAYARLRDITIPEMEELPIIKECIGKWIELTNNSYFYVTPVTIKGEMVCVNRSGISVRIKQNETCKIIQ